MVFLSILSYVFEMPLEEIYKNNMCGSKKAKGENFTASIEDFVLLRKPIGSSVSEVW